MTWSDYWLEARFGDGCPMCASVGAERSPSGNIRFFHGSCSDAYLAVRGPQRGYAIVIWRGRHVADPTELSDFEAIAFWRETLHVSRAMTSYFRPIKLNIEMLGNLVPHLHVHVTCRFAHHDIAPQRPISWDDRDHPIPVAQVERDAHALSELLATHP